MKKHLEEKYECGRLTEGYYGTKKHSGLMGAFYIPSPIIKNVIFLVLSSGPDNGDWEHVSVSLPGKKRTPNWAEMCFIKDIFWEKDECVVQFHPPESEYINNHPFTLHLWKPNRFEISLPPKICI